MDDTISITTQSLYNLADNDMQSELSTLQTLPKTMSKFHISLLFYQFQDVKSTASCKAHDSLVKNVGSCDGNVWKFVGDAYGVPAEDIELIDKEARERKSTDCVDVLLKLLTRNKTATLDILLQVLLDKEKLFTLESIKNPLLELKREFEIEDEGYYSGRIKVSTVISTRSIIYIEQKYIEHLINDIPTVLYRIRRDSDPYDSNQFKPLIKDDDSIVLLLTYAADGMFLVEDIKHKIKMWTDFPKAVKVWTLSDTGYKYNLANDPFDSKIISYCAQADYIIPIVTDAYLKEINGEYTFPTENLDHKYIKYIYHIISEECTRDRCIKRIRSVVTDDLINKIYEYYPLSAYICIREFDDFFRAILMEDIENQC